MGHWRHKSLAHFHTMLHTPANSSCPIVALHIRAGMEMALFSVINAKHGHHSIGRLVRSSLFAHLYQDGSAAARAALGRQLEAGDGPNCPVETTFEVSRMMPRR
jgi:hypothetical protein